MRVANQTQPQLITVKKTHMIRTLSIGLIVLFAITGACYLGKSNYDLHMSVMHANAQTDKAQSRAKKAESAQKKIKSLEETIVKTDNKVQSLTKSEADINKQIANLTQQVK